MDSLMKIKAPAVRGVGRPKKALDSERRFRRDIANNHERKRMQSINDGILALRRILHHKDIDKLSKATVLLRTAEYLIHMEAKLSLLSEENYRLKCLTKELIHKRVTTALTVQQLLFTSNKSLNKGLEECRHSDECIPETTVLDDESEAIDLSLQSVGKA